MASEPPKTPSQHPDAPVSSTSPDVRTGPNSRPLQLSTPPSAARAPSVGDVLDGKYRIEGKIGEGGMGTVLLAEHLLLQEKVAIKVMRTDVARGPAASERFLREARSLFKLQSPRVVRVLDLGTLDGNAPYIVMEVLDGVDLHSLISRDGPVSIIDAVDYVLQSCEALAEAHAQGIIHRDIKPANLFRTKGPDGRGFIKVLDFGVATAAEGAFKGALTQTASMMGSPSYMSPEQMRSPKLADARSDIWSLGCVLYELLTGRIPFPAESVAQLVVKVQGEKPTPPSLYRSIIQPDLEQIVLRCLEKDPNARYKSVGRLAEALATVGRALEAKLAAGFDASLDRIRESTLPFDSQVSIREKGATAADALAATMAGDGGPSPAATMESSRPDKTNTASPLQNTGNTWGRTTGGDSTKPLASDKPQVATRAWVWFALATVFGVGVTLIVFATTRQSGVPASSPDKVPPTVLASPKPSAAPTVSGVSAASSLGSSSASETPSKPPIHVVPPDRLR